MCICAFTCMHMHACMPQFMRGGQRTTYGSCFSASFIWYLEPKRGCQGWCRCHYPLSLLTNPSGVLKPQLCHNKVADTDIRAASVQSPSVDSVSFPSPLLVWGRRRGLRDRFFIAKVALWGSLFLQLPPKLSLGCFETASCSPGWPQISLCSQQWHLTPGLLESISQELGLWVFTTRPSLC